MNASVTCRFAKSSLKPIALAVALALPSSAALTAPMDAVKTRPDQNVDQQYGRDSVYAFSADSKPLSPDRTSGPHKFHTAQQEAVSANELNGGTEYVDSEAVPDAGSGYIDSQMALDAGSGYTRSEAVGTGYTASEDIVSHAGWGGVSPSTTGLALAGEAQDNRESKYAVVIPWDTDLMPSMSQNEMATQSDRGYSLIPGELTMIVITPDTTALDADQTASSEEAGSPAVAD